MDKTIIERKILSDEKYFNNLYEKKFNGLASPQFVNNVYNRFLTHTDYIVNISKIKNIDMDIIVLNDTFRLKIVNTIISCHLFNLEDIKATIVESDINYIDKLCSDVYSNLLISNLTDLELDSIFLSNPLVCDILFMTSFLKEHIKKINETPWNMEIKNILDSFESMLILISKSCFSQAMSVFRQAVEQYMILKCLDIYPEAKESFLEHQKITIKDATGILSEEELDDYIKENKLTYNNYKSYLNYGWLDSIEKFRKMKEENPRTKYSIKTVSVVADIPDFYEAMDFASNYVHSNFVFVKMDWNLVISQIIDGIFEMLDLFIDEFEGLSFIINGYDFKKLYIDIKERGLDIIKDEGTNFYID